MTRKVYKSALGKEVDLGALLLQNENVRAVGNMNVNARGDVLDSANRVIDQKNRQVQRQYKRLTNNVTGDAQLVSSTLAAKNLKNAPESKPADELTTEPDLTELDSAPTPTVQPAPVEVPPENIFPPTGEGGLAAAIARSRTIKQEKEKTLRERIQQQPLKKI